jgi:8-oxo-dGTP pyrophosphatase MutT (NUDIX family)
MHVPLRVEVTRQVAALPPPADLRERRSRLRLLAELERLPDPFERLAGPVHVTGSAIITGRRGTVLHMHRRLGLWLQPGGHLEPGETPWEAAVREGTEETGLDLRHPAGGPRLVHVDVHTGAAGHLHLDLRYLLAAPDADPRPWPDESPDVRWFSWAEARRAADPGLVGALAVICRHAHSSS